MRDGLITYANTIERSIDWRPFENVLNTNPNNITQSDLSGMNVQLNDACRANRDCHFIYLETFARSNFNPKNLPSRHPRESGDPCKRLIKMDSHFRGNDGF